MKTVFVNPERCIGCLQCEFACAVEHSSSRDPVLALGERPPPRTRVHVEPGLGPNTSFPVKCRHCDPAPCEQVCPTGAIARDPGRDLVLIEAERCIACGMCAMVCPFDALTFDPVADADSGRPVAHKCDGCSDRLERGEPPACVEVCKAGALVFGEINEVVGAARRAEAVAVLGALEGPTPPSPPVPESVATWRAWGKAAQALALTGGGR